MLNVSNNAMPWVYLVRAINAIYTIRTMYVLVGLLCVTANCQLFRAYRLWDAYLLLRFSILIRKTVYGCGSVRFGSAGFGLFSFRYWCVINAHRKFQQHITTQINAVRPLGSARLGSMNEPKSVGRAACRMEKVLLSVSLSLSPPSLSLSVSSCLRISVYFSVYWFLLWHGFGVWMTSCNRVNYGQINRGILIFLCKG